MQGNGLTLKHQLDIFMLTYCTTPHSTTGTSPCELLMGRSLRMRWDLLMQDTEKTVQERQQKQSEQRSSRAHVREFNIGDSVVAKNYGSGPAWLPGKIAHKLGPLTYIVDASDGRIWKRHVDHVKNVQIHYPCQKLSQKLILISIFVLQRLPSLKLYVSRNWRDL